MQSSVPELIAGLCPEHAEVEIFNEKETDIPLDRHWDLVFFSYLHSYYEHTKVLSTLFRQPGHGDGGGRAPREPLRRRRASSTSTPSSPASPRPTSPPSSRTSRRASSRSATTCPRSASRPSSPYRYDLIDFTHNKLRLPGIEASRGCPFSCNFCVLTGHERYRYRPVAQVIDEIQTRMRWNKNYFGLMDDAFVFLDNNLGGSPKYLRELCEALIPLKKTWGCALTFNVLKDEALVKLMARAGLPLHLHRPGVAQPRVHRGDEQGPEQAGRGGRRHPPRLLRPASCCRSGSSSARTETPTSTWRSCRSTSRTCATSPSPSWASSAPTRRRPSSARWQPRAGCCPAPSAATTTATRCATGPKNLHPSEVVEHFQRLCHTLGSLPNIARHYWSKLTMSDMPRYKQHHPLLRAGDPQHPQPGEEQGAALHRRQDALEDVGRPADGDAGAGAAAADLTPAATPAPGRRAAGLRPPAAARAAAPPSRDGGEHLPRRAPAARRAPVRQRHRRVEVRHAQSPSGWACPPGTSSAPRTAAPRAFAPRFSALPAPSPAAPGPSCTGRAPQGPRLEGTAAARCARAVRCGTDVAPSSSAKSAASAASTRADLQEGHQHLVAATARRRRARPQRRLLHLVLAHRHTLARWLRLAHWLARSCTSMLMRSPFSSSAHSSPPRRPLAGSGRRAPTRAPTPGASAR